MSCILETVSGRQIDITSPDPAAIDVTDIFWVLSRIPRFNGHSVTLVPYNVAQHSLFVAKTAQKLRKCAENSPDFFALGIYGSLHDGAEAYLSDLPSPVKRHPELYPVFKSMEEKLDVAIFDAVGIPRPSEEMKKIVKQADLIAQKIEAYNYMVSRGKTWEGLEDINLSIIDLQKFEDPMPALESFKKLSKFYDRMLSGYKTGK
jgi:5'-deoxynucleotidase YfbR-like HD superfamily hydrolase